jgi:hypothetical protein
MSEGKFIRFPQKVLSNQEKITTFPSDTGSQSTLLDGIIELCLWGSLGMSQNFLCCTIPCKVWFFSLFLEGKSSTIFSQGESTKSSLCEVHYN